VTDSLADIDWLTRSTNRVETFERLGDGPYTRGELKGAAGVTRVTLNQTPANREDRDWIIRDDSGYKTTLGDLVSEDLRALRETAALSQELHDIQQYLPVEEFDFDLRLLQDGRITIPSKGDTTAPLRRSAEIIRTTTGRIRGYGAAIDPPSVKAVVDSGTLSKERPTELILTDNSIDLITSDSELTEWFSDLAVVDTTQLFYYEGEFAYALELFDGLIAIELNDKKGFVPALIESDDEAVLDWAERIYDRYKREAESIGPDAFAS
jgi:predicted transcriptional regulator